MNKNYLPLSLVATALLSSAAIAQSDYSYKAGQWVVRAGATKVSPREDSDDAKLDGSTLVLGGQTSSLALDDDTQLGITVEYLLDEHWGVELLVATPFEHTASGKGAVQGVDIAEFKHLPPTLSAIYHFTAMDGVQPYVGAGLNYTLIFDEKMTSQADATFAGLGLTGGDVELDDSVGISLQVGVDYHIDDSWLINASARWIDLNTEAEIEFDNGSKLTDKIEVDPWVYTLSVGYKF